MILQYWSVPVLDRSTIELPGPYSGQRKQLTTTIYAIGNRRRHRLDLRMGRPVSILNLLLTTILHFAGIYIATVFVPGIILAVTKDPSLSWVFKAWALPVLVIAVVTAREHFLSGRMLKHARNERGLAASAQLHIVPDRKWNQWISKLK